jgi:hypothetical protein
MTRRTFLATPSLAAAVTAAPAGKLRAGSAATNITPPLGSSIAGSMTESRSLENHDELHAKSLVLESGSARLALAQVDSCMLPATAVAEAKRIVERECQIPLAHIAICATHSHSAATAMHLFQSRPDPGYVDFLVRRIADSIRMSVARLQPARLGFAFGREDRLIFNRRYFLKDGAVPPNPFGAIDKVRTNPGIGNPAVMKVAGPVDPMVGLLAVQSADGKPIAVVGNYSLHYVGGVGRGHISADYFAYWAASMARRMGVGAGPGSGPFAAILLNGCSGNINNVDVLGKPQPAQPAYGQMSKVAEILADETARLLGEIRYTDDVLLGASEEWLELGVRFPGADDVQAARKKLADAGPPKDGQYREQPLIYARETVVMAETFPKVERVPLQAFRIGGAGVSFFPGEPFVELGLGTKAKSPFRQNFTVGLSNGAVGYIPTPEAHELGGYETWRAKSSYLEKGASPKLVAAALRRLGAIAG